GLLGAAQSLERADPALLEHRDRCQARKDRLAIDHHYAGAALAKPAAELSAVQAEVVAQHIKERRRGIGVDLLHAAVDVELGHRSPFDSLRTSPATSVHAGCPESARR